MSAFFAGVGAYAGFFELKELQLVGSQYGNKIIDRYRSDLTSSQY